MFNNKLKIFLVLALVAMVAFAETAEMEEEAKPRPASRPKAPAPKTKVFNKGPAKADPFTPKPNTLYLHSQGERNVVVQPTHAKYVHFYTMSGNGPFTMNANDFSFSLEAMGGSDISFAFMPKMQQRTNDCWEVVIGTAQNSKSVIRSGTQGRVLTTVNGPRANGGYFMSYTVTVKKGVMTVSENSKVFMTARVPKLSSNKVFVGVGAWEVPVTYSNEGGMGGGNGNGNGGSSSGNGNGNGNSRGSSSGSSAQRSISAPSANRGSQAPQTSAATAAKDAEMLAEGKEKVNLKFSVEGNQAHYTNFVDVPITEIDNGFDFVFQAKGSNDIHVAFMTSKADRSSDSWEIVLGGWGNTRSVIRSGSQGQELASVEDNESVGPADKWRTYYISYDADSSTLSVWNDAGSNNDAALMSAVVPVLSTTDKIYPAFAAWDSPVEFTTPVYVDIGDGEDFTGGKA